MFEFPELCESAVAAADYIALSGAFHTVALSGVPVFGPANRSAAYRFVTLVDVLYENR
jgi:protein AFG1